MASSLSKPSEGSGDRQLLRTARDQGVTLGTQSRKRLRTTHMESGTQAEAISLGTAGEESHGPQYLQNPVHLAHVDHETISAGDV